VVVAKSLLQEVVLNLLISNFAESWRTGAEESYIQRNIDCFQGIMGLRQLWALNIFTSVYLNMKYSQVACADEINVLDFCSKFTV
jgi:hypothetical protein